jgi:hypothetical protein
MGDEVWFLLGWMGALAPPITVLPTRSQNAVDGGLAGQIGALIEQYGPHLGERLSR